jgi:hypothetical protein
MENGIFEPVLLAKFKKGGQSRRISLSLPLNLDGCVKKSRCDDSPLPYLNQALRGSASPPPFFSIKSFSK